MPINFPFEFDFKNPDYKAVEHHRIDRLKVLLQKPEFIPVLINHYKDNIAQFIIDWGMIYNPKAEGEQPLEMPFILSPIQEECVNKIISNWKSKKDLIIDKTREMGVSWICVAVAASICLFYPKVLIGFGSRKEMFVDSSSDPDCLFWKIRYFLKSLPAIFRFGWDELKHSKHMFIMLPHNESGMKGEAGKGFGRGGRKTLQFNDEAGFIENFESLNASLASTTNCRIDVSTVPPTGRGHPFGQRRFSGKIDVFTLDWRNDPFKDQKWYDDYCEKLLHDQAIIARELDINYDAAQDNPIIPSAWVNAAVDAHVKLGIQISGIRRAGLDIADEGKDLNAICGRHGVLIEKIESWSGKGKDILLTVERAFSFCDINSYKALVYDADGPGVGARGGARIINEKRTDKINVIAFRGSGAIFSPSSQMVYGRKNQDLFLNAKAQNWWALRMRFEKTYRAVVEGREFKEDEIISISSEIKDINKLISELSQPEIKYTDAGKIIIDKMPECAKSPNLADSVMIAFSQSSGIGIF